MFTCPSCEESFERVKPGGTCPHCKAKLTKSKDGYILRGRREEDGKDDYSLLYWDGVVRLEKHRDSDKYIMRFFNVTPNSWIRCPNCKAKLFQNRIVNGELDTKCKRCKSIITYIFG